jgi:hypothetical protein
MCCDLRKSPAPKIAQFQPNGSQATYQPIKQTEDMPKSATVSLI